MFYFLSRRTYQNVTLAVPPNSISNLNIGKVGEGGRGRMLVMSDAFEHGLLGKNVMSIPLFSPGDGPLVVVVSSSKICGKGGGGGCW